MQTRGGDQGVRPYLLGGADHRAIRDLASSSGGRVNRYPRSRRGERVDSNPRHYAFGLSDIDSGFPGYLGSGANRNRRI